MPPAWSPAMPVGSSQPVAELVANASSKMALEEQVAAPGVVPSTAELQDHLQTLLRSFSNLTEQVCFWAGDVDICARERCQLGDLVLTCVQPCVHMDQGLAEFYKDLQQELRSLHEEMESAKASSSPLPQTPRVCEAWPEDHGGDAS